MLWRPGIRQVEAYASYLTVEVRKPSMNAYLEHPTDARQASTRTVAPERQQSREFSYRAAELARLTGNGRASRVTLPALQRQASNPSRASALCLTGQGGQLLSASRHGYQLRPADGGVQIGQIAVLHRPVARHHQPATTSDRLRHSLAFRLRIVTDPSRKFTEALQPQIAKNGRNPEGCLRSARSSWVHYFRSQSRDVCALRGRRA